MCARWRRSSPAACWSRFPRPRCRRTRQGARSASKSRRSRRRGNGWRKSSTGRCAASSGRRSRKAFRWTTRRRRTRRPKQGTAGVRSCCESKEETHGDDPFHCRRQACFRRGAARNAAAARTWRSCAPSSARKPKWSEETTMDRREFLKTSGALVISFAAPSFEAIAQSAGKPALVPGELDSWIAVLPNGNVQAFFGKMDMGQGLDVAVAQIVAEELDVGFDKVAVLMGDTGSSCNQGGASGSTGVSNGARLMRRAAAEARRVLVERGSEKLGTPAADLRVEDGVVIGPKGNTTYADLVGG